MFERRENAGMVARWLIAGLLLLVQLHLCQAEYVLPSGQKCLTCPSLVEQHKDDVQLSDGNHGDCHDCCELRPCDDNDKAPSAVLPVSLLNLTMALPIVEVQVTHFDFRVPILRIEFLVGTPTNGPPATTRSRAPPYSSRV